MKINAKTRYGVRTMLEIAATDQQQGILQRTIAEKQGISEKYLDQIISALKVARLIRGVSPGKRGYQLTRPAVEISIYDIYIAFNGRSNLIDCLEDERECKKFGFCATSRMWGELNDVMKAYLLSFSLKRLKDEQLLFNEEMSGNYLYYI